jgi:transposase-like protein
MGTFAVRYSEAFKMQVVRELESGELRSFDEAGDRYGIQGSITVSRWVKKYGSERIQRRIVRVETTGERDQIKALKMRIAQLERALVDSKVSEALHKAYFDIVCEKCGVKDPEELKKNIEQKLSGEEAGTAKRKKG